MEDDGLTLPPYDWAIEPQGLGPNVMTAHTLFSDSQPRLVARVLNNSCDDKVLPADTFLGMAEPVQCLSGDGYYYRFSQHRDHLQWRLVLGYYS